MDFQQYLLALQARRKVFLLVFAAILVTAVTVALVLPKRYDATATVLLDARDEQTTTPGRISPRERAGWVYTQVDLIQSGKVANRVVRDLKLAQQPGVREQFESETGGVGTIEDWLGAALLEKVKVDTGASNVLIIKYSSSDPQKASTLATSKPPPRAASRRASAPAGSTPRSISSRAARSPTAWCATSSSPSSRARASSSSPRPAASAPSKTGWARRCWKSSRSTPARATC